MPKNADDVEELVALNEFTGRLMLLHRKSIAVKLFLEFLYTVY